MKKNTKKQDPFTLALTRLRSDRRSFEELERATGIPAETIRNVARRITRNPRLDTVKRLANHYGLI